jgi:hypothetical protein
MFCICSPYILSTVQYFQINKFTVCPRYSIPDQSIHSLSTVQYFQINQFTVCPRYSISRSINSQFAHSTVFPDQSIHSLSTVQYFQINQFTVCPQYSISRSINSQSESSLAVVDYRFSSLYSGVRGSKLGPGTCYLGRHFDSCPYSLRANFGRTEQQFM